jgi:hypothetical protein
MRAHLGARFFEIIFFNMQPQKNKTPVTVPKAKAATPKRRKRRARKARPANVVLAQTLLPKPCTFHYARALLDPFNGQLKEASPCVPDAYDFPSFKYQSRFRGVFVVGTLGVGFVVVSPRTGVNDVPFIAVTDALWAGGTISVSGPGIVRATDPQIPYPATSSPNIRLVACGVRARYIGTELQRGGQLIPFFTPNDDVIDDSITEITSRAVTNILPVTRRWGQVNWLPSTPDDYTFSNIQNAGLTSNAVTMGIAVSAGTVGTFFEYEIIRFWEAIPSLENNVTTPGQTRSHSDIPGLSTIRDFTGGLSNTAKPSDYNDWVKSLTNGVEGAKNLAALGGAAYEAFRPYL